MIIGIGTDLIETSRVKGAINRRKGFLTRVFTQEEQDYCFSRDNPWPSFAVRFAAKEAVMKSLGVGFSQCSFNEIEIIKTDGGKPLIRLYGKALTIANSKGINYWHVSLSHNKTQSLAFVVAEKSADKSD